MVTALVSFAILAPSFACPDRQGGKSGSGAGGQEGRLPLSSRAPGLAETPSRSLPSSPVPRDALGSANEAASQDGDDDLPPIDVVDNDADPDGEGSSSSPVPPNASSPARRNDRAAGLPNPGVAGDEQAQGAAGSTPVASGPRRHGGSSRESEASPVEAAAAVAAERRRSSSGLVEASERRGTERGPMGAEQRRRRRRRLAFGLGGSGFSESRPPPRPAGRQAEVGVCWCKTRGEGGGIHRKVEVQW